ncbi:hypothetical protein BH10PSE12_BH10PSE12_13040 [soil metagenome]
MVSYKAPAFQDRLALAAQAKQKALDKLKAKPPVDEAVLAQRIAAAAAKEAAAAEKRAAKIAERERIEAEKAQAEADRLQAEAEEAARIEAARPVVIPVKVPSAAEMKAARDARYAARKARK